MKPKKKLSLNKETVKKLTTEEMSSVQGGTGTSSWTANHGCQTTGSACGSGCSEHVVASGSAEGHVSSSWWPF